MHLLRFQSPYDVAIFFLFIVHTSLVVFDLLIYESIRHKVDQTYVENPSKAKGEKTTIAGQQQYHYFSDDYRSQEIYNEVMISADYKRIYRGGNRVGNAPA
jgi:hypothetical protein